MPRLPLPHTLSFSFCNDSLAFSRILCLCPPQRLSLIHLFFLFSHLLTNELFCLFCFFLCIHLCFPQILSIFITIFVLPPPLTLLSVDSKLVCSGVDVVLGKKGTPMEQQRTKLRDTVVDFIRLFPN